MGHAMVQHIIQAGYDVYVHNRTKSKTDDLVEFWAVYKDSIAELSQECDIIFTIIWDPKNVAETYFGNTGIIENTKEGSILVDMTTTKPSLSQEIYKKAQEKNISTLDAPVSGWDIWAIEWKLSIMVGWDREVFNEILPLFELMWKSITHIGWAWTGQDTKMANVLLGNF